MFASCFISLPMPKYFVKEVLLFPDLLVEPIVRYCRNILMHSSSRKTALSCRLPYLNANCLAVELELTACRAGVRGFESHLQHYIFRGITNSNGADHMPDKILELLVERVDQRSWKRFNASVVRFFCERANTLSISY